MRIWHFALLPYLPELQFKGQLRELVWIMRQWRDSGKTNHLLINKVMEYPKSHLSSYFFRYCREYEKRYNKEVSQNVYDEFSKFAQGIWFSDVFPNWHNKEYLRVCMANLYEKNVFGVGKSRMSDEEWETLLRGYKELTGEEYVI